MAESYASEYVALTPSESHELTVALPALSAVLPTLSVAAKPKTAPKTVMPMTTASRILCLAIRLMSCRIVLIPSLPGDTRVIVRGRRNIGRALEIPRSGQQFVSRTSAARNREARHVDGVRFDG